MRSTVLATSIALAATALPAPASARDREFVQASAWQVARAPEYCRLVRAFAEGDGSIEDCIVQAETIPEDFGAEVCRAVRKKAEFLPALDRTGTPIRSYYTTLVRFQLP